MELTTDTDKYHPEHTGKLSFSIQLSGQEGWAQARPDMSLQGQGKAPERGTLQPGGKT